MSPRTLEAHEFPLKEVFCDKYTFEIPGYQRPYAWTQENALTLVDDILTYLEEQPANLEEANPYFLGSIVLIKEHEPKADVVDGQQRLTTLTILFSVLRYFRKERLPQVEDKAPFSNWIFQLGNPDLGTVDRPRLTLRKEDQAFFFRYIQQNDALESLMSLNGNLSDSQKNIHANAKIIFNKIGTLNGPTIQRLCVFLLNHCYLVLVTTPDIDSAFRIFSVMNDRGLDLTTTDILKTLIVGEIPQANQDPYFDKWVGVEEKLGRDLFNELFTHIRMIEQRNKLTGSVLSEYKKHIKPMDYPQQFIDEKLIPYSEAFSKILFDEFRNADISYYISWLNRIDNADWLPPAIYFLKSNSCESELLRFFRLLERLASVMMILRYNINQRIYRYRDVLADIDAGRIFEETSTIQLSTEEMCWALDALEGPVYSVTRTRMPILLRAERTLHDGTARYDNTKISIEHVMPQSPKGNSEWVRLCPDGDEYSRLVHTLGNLVLLSRSKNSAASNYDFEKKKEEYFFKKNVSTPFILTNELRNIEKWTPEVIKKRTAKFVSNLAKEWDLECAKSFSGDQE